MESVRVYNKSSKNPRFLNYQNVILTNEVKSKFLSLADEAAKSDPETFEWFKSLCKKHTTASAMAMCHLSKDCEIVAAWAIKLREEGIE